MDSRISTAAAVLGLIIGLAAPAFCQAPTTKKDVDRAISQLDELAKQTMESSGIPGLAIAVVYNDEVVMLKGYGVRDVSKKDPVTPDTVFQIASVSKPVTTSLIAKLVGDGHIGWDVPAADILPQFRLNTPRATREATLRTLSSHRSGLPNSGGDLMEDLGFNQSRIFSRLRHFPLKRPLGESYSYSNFGMTAAGMAAVRAAGMEFEEAAQTYLFGPLGMTSTSTKFAAFRDAENRAVGASPPTGRLVPNGTWVNRFTRNPEQQAPAGGVFSSVRDLSKWMRMQLNGGEFEGRQIVPRRELAETHRIEIMTSATGGYALGWNNGRRLQRRFLSHSGEFITGFRSVVTLSLSDNLGIAVLANSSPHGIPEGLALSFMDYAIVGELTQKWMDIANGAFLSTTAEQFEGDGINYRRGVENPKPALPLSAYTGSYRNAVYGPISIRKVGGRLAARIGPDRQRYVVRHFDGNTFFLRTRGENQSGARGVKFARVRGGSANRVTLNFLDKFGLGSFRATSR